MMPRIEDCCRQTLSFLRRIRNDSREESFLHAGGGFVEALQIDKRGLEKPLLPLTTCLPTATNLSRSTSNTSISIHIDTETFVTEVKLH